MLIKMKTRIYVAPAVKGLNQLTTRLTKVLFIHLAAGITYKSLLKMNENVYECREG